MFNKMAEQHRRAFLRLLAEGEDVIVRMPPAKVASTNPAVKALGSTSTSTVGETYVTRALISGAVLSTSGGLPLGQENIFPVGTLHEADLILRFYIPEILLDPSRPLGMTYVDKCKDMIIGGERFERIGKTPRTGLAPAEPFILWVAVKRVGEGV